MRYEHGLALILCLAIGLSFTEQVGINYLIPFIKPQLGLSNGEVGLLISGALIAQAAGSFAGGAYADYIGKPKRALLTALLLFSLCSVVTAFTQSFATLFAARLLMGFLLGTIVPIAMTIMALEAPPQNKGVYMGITQNLGGSLIGLFVAPFAFVSIATAYGWRAGFFLVILPGLLCALLTYLFVREPTLPEGSADASAGHGKPAGALKEVLGFRNIWLCAAIFSLIMAFAFTGWAFLPLWYMDVRHFSAQQMSFLMSALGVSAASLGIIVPAFSDRLGRKPAIAVATLLGVVCPLAAVFYPGPVIMLAGLVFIGWTLVTAVPLVTSALPSETVPARVIGTAVAFIVAVGSLVGGLSGPALAGWCADRWGLQAALYVQAGCAVAAAALALFLRESTAAQRKEERVAFTH